MTPDKYQQKVIDCSVGPWETLIVDATAGSGKSTTIVEKVTKEISEGLYKPESVVILSFSNKASSDIRRKIVARGNRKVNVSTTHKLMMDLVRKYTGKSLSVMNEWSSLMMIREVLFDLGYGFSSKREATNMARTINNYISTYRCVYFKTPIREFDLHDTPYLDDIIVSSKEFHSIYEQYTEYKLSRNLYDFDDLLSDRVINMIPTDKTKKDYSLIIVDEYQDNNASNHYTLQRLFAGLPFIGVGDIGQLLYHFRYADPTPMTEDNYWHDLGYTTVKRLPLLYNYRSNGSIVKTANAYRDGMDGLVAESTIDTIPGSVKMLTVKNDVQIGLFVAREIRKLMSEGFSPSDITVLVRKSSFIKSILEPNLTIDNIPYKVTTPQYKKKFYDVPINQVFLVLMTIWVTKDVNQIKNIAQHFQGIGMTYQERIQKHGFFDDDKSALLKEIAGSVMSFHMQDSYLNIPKLVEYIGVIVMNYVKPTVYTDKKLAIISKTLASVAMTLGEEEAIEPATEVIEMFIQSIHDYAQDYLEAVNLTTIHQYKGLENKIVFLTNISDINYDIDPSTYPVMFVGLTRPKDKLYIVKSESVITRKIGTIKAKQYPGLDRMEKLLFHS